MKRDEEISRCPTNPPPPPSLTTSIKHSPSPYLFSITAWRATTRGAPNAHQVTDLKRDSGRWSASGLNKPNWNAVKMRKQKRAASNTGVNAPVTAHLQTCVSSPVPSMRQKLRRDAALSDSLCLCANACVMAAFIPSEKVSAWWVVLSATQLWSHQVKRQRLRADFLQYFLVQSITQTSSQDRCLHFFFCRRENSNMAT